MSAPLKPKICDGVESPLERQLLAAAKAGNAALINALLEMGADASWRDEEGVTSLMRAAEAGCCEGVAALLQAGAPWHAQDREGYTAGEYASGSGEREVLDHLLDWAVSAELLLGAAARGGGVQGSCLAPAPPPNQDYLQQKVVFQDGKILDAEGEAVMMGWEAPLMEQHAQLICGSRGDVLNVGFGLGIVDQHIQALAPRSHTIIEAHPDVYTHMMEQGWGRKPGVRVLFGRWQDVIEELGPFDGIFFDTYGEYYEDMREFQAQLPRLLRKPGGVYSFFNGLAPDNLFFHLVYGRIVQLELGQMGLNVQYTAVPVDWLSEQHWQGVRNKYWHFTTYFLPSVTWAQEEVQGKDEDTPGASPVSPV